MLSRALDKHRGSIGLPDCLDMFSIFLPFLRTQHAKDQDIYTEITLLDLKMRYGSTDEGRTGLVNTAHLLCWSTY